MRRPHAVLILSLVAGCSFPTKEFTLAGPTSDVPPNDGPTPDTPPIDSPTPDVAPDDAADVAPDTAPDTAPDVAPDVTPDAAPDVAPDAPTDVSSDTPSDAPSDAPPDAPADAGACPMSFQIRCAPPDGGVGVCVNPLNDPMNCGVCNRACATGQNCLLGGCQYPSMGYTRSTPTVAFEDACAARGSHLMLPNPDDSAVLVALPFSFRLFGTTIAAGTMVNVSTNGFLSLQSVASSGYRGDIPSMDAPNAVIAPFWTDLLVRNATAAVCVATVGATVGSRTFVVQWNDVNWFGAPAGAPTMTFQAVLHEGTNLVDFVYQSVVPRPPELDRTLTIGLENAAGLNAFAICNGAYSSCGIAAGSRVRLTPL